MNAGRPNHTAHAKSIDLQRLDDRRPLIVSAFARARASFSCNYMAPLLALRFRVSFETILPGKRESLS